MEQYLSHRRRYDDPPIRTQYLGNSTRRPWGSGRLRSPNRRADQTASPWLQNVHSARQTAQAAWEAATIEPRAHLGNTNTAQQQSWEQIYIISSFYDSQDEEESGELDMQPRSQYIPFLSRYIRGNPSALDQTATGQKIPRGLTAEQIGMIPSKQYQPSHLSQEKEMCCICHCDFEQIQLVKQLKCSHLYHSSCIAKWLNMNSLCPLCKADTQPVPSKSQPFTQSQPTLNRNSSRRYEMSCRQLRQLLMHSPESLPYGGDMD